MQNDLTDITILLDRSGSMTAIADDTVGGYRAFIEKQRSLPGRCVVSLFQFDNEFECVYTALPAGDVPELIFEPRASTALLYAMCRAIAETGARLRAMPEDDRPAHVMFVTITDGEENASGAPFTYDHLSAVIDHQQKKYNWRFLYLGANQDAIKAASRMGIHASSTLTFHASGDGTKSAFYSVSKYAANVRAGDAAAQFDAEDRELQRQAAQKKPNAGDES